MICKLYVVWQISLFLKTNLKIDAAFQARNENRNGVFTNFRYISFKLDRPTISSQFATIIKNGANLQRNCNCIYVALRGSPKAKIK